MPHRPRDPDSRPSSPAAKPNPARVRENQRRSRARRKEYLEELEARLRNFESLGVQASVDIQHSARAVVAENVRLREENAQLRIVNDRLKQELEAKTERKDNVSADRDSQSLEREECSRDGSRTWTAVCGPAVESNGQPETEPLQSSFHTTGRCDEEISTVNELSLPISTHQDFLQPSPTSTNPSTSDIDQPSRNETASHDRFPAQQETNAQEVTYRQSNHADFSTDTSSCEYAAQIITSMRADVTPDDVRADLGCNESIEEWEKCKVNNAKLFVAMDLYTV